MTAEQLVQLILHHLNLASEVASVSRIEGEDGPEPAIGVEMQDGSEFFVTVEPA
jgi:hypothetical protein